MDKSKEVKVDIWADPDLAQLLFASEENRDNEVIEAQQAPIDDVEIIDIPDEQDPVKAHELYYELEGKIREALKGVTPEAKKFIREQKRLLLNDGEIKDRDNRQAYYYRIQQAINITDRWSQLCLANQIPPTESKTFRLYCMLKDAVESIAKKPEQMK